ncbi:MAG: CRISPR system precrRNA processing endoribonuclease RAMP protein Cas6 [Acidobacteriota bacterium]
MVPEDFAPLTIARYQLSLRACEATTLPRFLGSTLRGAFGHALKQAVCVMPHRNCDRCLVSDRCIYPYLFETPPPPDVQQLRGQQNAPHPFILTPLETREFAIENREMPLAPLKSGATPTVRSDMAAAVRLVKRAESTQANPVAGERRHFAVGDELAFELVLLGAAIEYLPYIIYAVSEMAGCGLGAERARFALEEVFAVSEAGDRTRIYAGEGSRLTGQSAANSLVNLIEERINRLARQGVVAALERNEPLRLRFMTPTRIRANDDLQVNLSFAALVKNLLRRVSLLAAVHGAGELALDYRELIARAAAVKTLESKLGWHDWQRYSNRQQTHMKFGGFIGDIAFVGDPSVSNPAVEEPSVNNPLKAFLPLLIAGELLHVGSNTAFGLGKFEIVV